MQRWISHLMGWATVDVKFPYTTMHIHKHKSASAHTHRREPLNNSLQREGDKGQNQYWYMCVLVCVYCELMFVEPARN